MTVLTIVALAALQHSTEPLPISPAAHLIPVPAITGWPDRGFMVAAARYPDTRLVKGVGVQ